MWGWVGELASAFAGNGFEGLVLLALLIVIGLLIRANTAASKAMARMHDGMIGALDRSSDAQSAITRVLGRIEGILRMEPDDDTP